MEASLVAVEGAIALATATELDVAEPVSGTEVVEEALTSMVAETSRSRRNGVPPVAYIAPLEPMTGDWALSHWAKREASGNLPYGTYARHARSGWVGFKLRNAAVLSGT